MQKKNTALDAALRSLSLRAHSEGEIQKKLIQRGFDEREIAAAMAKLAAYDLLDDGAFAKAWVASRARRGLGAYRIKRELAQKGIDTPMAEEALAQIDEEAWLAGAMALCEKHLARGGNTAPRRAYDAMVRKGYSFSQAKKALDAAGAALVAKED